MKLASFVSMYPELSAMRYSLLLHNVEPANSDISPDVIAAFQAAYTKYAKSLSVPWCW
jgi:hypothetical protein